MVLRASTMSFYARWYGRSENIATASPVSLFLVAASQCFLSLRHRDLRCEEPYSPNPGDEIADVRPRLATVGERPPLVGRRPSRQSDDRETRARTRSRRCHRLGCPMCDPISPRRMSSSCRSWVPPAFATSGGASAPTVDPVLHARLCDTVAAEGKLMTSAIPRRTAIAVTLLVVGFTRCSTVAKTCACVN